MKRLVLSFILSLGLPGLAVATTPSAAGPQAPLDNPAKPAEAAAVAPMPGNAAEALEDKKHLFDEGLLLETETEIETGAAPAKPAASVALSPEQGV